MADTATMTAAPVEVELGDKTLRLRPLTLADIGEFESWMRQRLIQTILAAAESLPATERRGLIQEAISAAARLHFDSPEAQGMMGSIEGATRLIWMSARREHPDLTTADLTSIAGQAERFGDAIEKVLQISFPQDAAAAGSSPAGGKASEKKGAANPAASSGSSSA